MPGIRWISVSLIVLLATMAGCATSAEPGQSDTEFGTQAIWHIADDAAVTSSGEHVDIEVQRVDCASGKTGDIADARVSYHNDRIVITVLLEAITGNQSCQSNAEVPYTVEFDEPIGQRDLVDGACSATPAARTTHCSNAVRWTPRQR